MRGPWELLMPRRAAPDEAAAGGSDWTPFISRGVMESRRNPVIESVEEFEMVRPGFSLLYSWVSGW